MNPQTSEPIMNLWTSGPSDYRTFDLMILRATRQNPPQQLTYLSKSTENRIKNCMIDRCLKLKQIHGYFKIILIVPFQSLVIVADSCRFYWDTKHHKIPTWFSWPSQTLKIPLFLKEGTSFCCFVAAGIVCHMCGDGFRSGHISILGPKLGCNQKRCIMYRLIRNAKLFSA